MELKVVEIVETRVVLERALLTALLLNLHLQMLQVALEVLT